MRTDVWFAMNETSICHVIYLLGSNCDMLQEHANGIYMGAYSSGS